MKRSLALRLSSFGLVASLGHLACTPPQVPQAVGEADAMLERHETRTLASARPKLVAEARDLSRRAREAAERGDTERAILLARQAVQKLETAKNFAERDQAERMLVALEKGGASRAPRTDESRDGAAGASVRDALLRAEAARDEAVRGGARPSLLAEGDELLRAARRAETSDSPEKARGLANEARSHFDSLRGRGVDREARDGSPSLQRLAERSLVALALRRGELLGQMRDQSCAAPFREFEAVLELGQRRYDVGDYERAYEFALRADERLRACDPRTGPQTPAAQTKSSADEDALRKKATAALQKAQIELSRVQAQNREDPAAMQGQALLQSGDTWFARRAYAEAADMASRAYAILSRVKAAPEAPRNAAKDEADEALAEARTARDQATDAAARTKGLELLSQAERAYAAKSLGDAKTTARKATAAFRAGPGDPCDAARARLAEAREAERTAESDPRRKGETRTSDTELALAEKKLAERACAEALAIVNRAAPRARSSDARGGRAWDAALVAIKEAERARDEARSRGASDIAVERGDIGLKTASLAYAREDFADAARAAREARDLYAESGQSLVPPMLAAQSRADEHLASRARALAAVDATAPGHKAAYEAIFRALAAREDAARESPLDREALAKADTMISSARKHWERQAFSEAAREAKAASAWLARLASPAPETLSVEEAPFAKDRAQAALAMATEIAAACERGRCDDRDLPRALEGKTLLVAARRAAATQRPGAARDLAIAAAERYSSAIDKPRRGHEGAQARTDAEKAAIAETDTALRDAEAAKRTCETRGCGPEARAAREAFLSARLARADGLTDESRRLAREAEHAFRAATLPAFEIPLQSREVSRNGEALVMTPPLAFKPGQRDVATEGSMAALARTIVDNTRALRRVRIAVTVEAKGAEAAARKLAEARAEALATALVFRGVPRDLLAVEVGGKESDVAAPARVDVVIELREGVK
ncbi:MAG: hypothetical protein IPK71_19350 [Myxococcales bacterium]|nr:hypothetical protein [Myxococcales bacterium]